MYDLNYSAPEAREFLRSRRGYEIEERRSEVVRKGREAPGGAYVRFSMYEVNYNFEAG